MNLFLPGPTQVQDQYLQLMATPMIGHRTTDYADLHQEVVSLLQELFFAPNYQIFILASSASAMMEGAIKNCVQEKVLHSVCGAFSERWAEMSELNQKQVVRLEIPWGQAIDPTLLQDKLQEVKPEAVCITHCETSTGVLNPLAELVKVIKQNSEALVFVDAVSSAGGVELNLRNLEIDVLVFGTQKCLALPPGLSFAFVSERALKKSKQISNCGYYTNFQILEKYAAQNNTPATPNISLMSALRQKLRDIRDEGILDRTKRHLQMQKIILEGIDEFGLELFPARKIASPTVSVIKNTLGIETNLLCQKMAQKGFLIAPGYGEMKREYFRIGHMGDHGVEEVFELKTQMSKLQKIN